MGTLNRALIGNYGANNGVAKPKLKTSVNILGDATPDNLVHWYDFYVSGTWLYAARFYGGIYAIDMSNPASPSSSANSVIHKADGGTANAGCRAAVLVGTTLVTCGRGTDGFIETFLESTPGTLASNVGTTTDVYVGSGQKYSDLATDGAYVYAAGQLSGFFVFNPADPTNILLHGSLTTGDFETQGICVHAGYAYCANYDNGIKVIDISDPANPALVVDIPVLTVNGDQVRPWKLAAKGNYLYISTNSTTDSNERGLLTVDISDPATLTASTDEYIGYAKIPPEDQDTWNNANDRMMGGINIYGDYVFAANGSNGVVVWNVSNPTQPIYMGTLGRHDSGDYIIDVNVVNIAGKLYMIYGDGTQPAGEGSDKLYIDEIIFK